MLLEEEQSNFKKYSLAKYLKLLMAQFYLPLTLSPSYSLSLIAKM